MKKQQYIVAVIAAATLLGSCSKDFLERAPQDQLSQSTFWTSEKDAYAALNGIYGPALDYVETAIYNDGSSDNAHAQYPWESNATTISLGDVNSGMNAGWSFSTIRRANYFLENIDKAPMSATLKDRFKAEARFLRAFDYADLINKFGDVPLVTKTLTLEESFVGRNTKAEVLKFVLDELTAVAAVLPESYSGGKNTEKGRVTKGAALALKARVLLYNGQWQEAADAAQAVMALNYDLFKVTAEADVDKGDDYSAWVNFADAGQEQKFRLGVRSYEQLFWQVNEGNKEVILDRQQIPEKDAKYDNTYLLADDLGGWSSVTPTQTLVNDYQSFQTGEPITPITPAARADLYAKRATDPAFYEEYKNRDPRFYATVLFEKAPWNRINEGDGYEFTWVKGGNNCSKTGYNFRKYVDPASTIAQLDNNANHIIIRLAEILLTYAEAKNEASGPDASVYAAINRIRNRAGMPDLNATVYNTKDKLREAIRRERRIELALEGHRYMDIRRWKIAATVMTNLNDLTNGLVQTRKWDDKLYLMPVPQSEVDLNSKLKPNNNGY
ncbi:RagB/SusD family nutrient uptake outer membrane protein [Paraflavitalea sp. CAU 1676]|uniref:RagB/SusD family nutrient uptake outer membrane protein n=1 Tax=Paraflavitalea sp. CAU 1676 TaxID=3032598 RepID=UPI0023DA989E|nr:RagB/SusD family nutrient uptake outer membrane protein [Paraflavitalea sp. CAU 1676]MDF2193716.1 RagB/SusD family nutrient uptake outer membrane protein [Paraflavitalea sp. CAU 1676]